MLDHSRYTGWKLATLALNLFTNFSLLPLQMMSLVGIVVAVGGTAVSADYLFAYNLGWIAVSGYASTIVAILVLGGLQLLALGIQGEYLGRLHLNANRKPQYTIRTVLGRDESAFAAPHSWSSNGTGRARDEAVQKADQVRHL